jgi:hypothetical protein
MIATSGAPARSCSIAEPSPARELDPTSATVTGAAVLAKNIVIGSRFPTTTKGVPNPGFGRIHAASVHHGERIVQLIGRFQF